MPKNSIRRLGILSLAGGAILFCGLWRSAAAVFQWDANPEPNIAGYYVYLGPSSRAYTQVIDVGPETQYPLTNLNAGATYFIAVTAYDYNRFESAFSEEVVYTPRVDGVTARALGFQLSVQTNVTLRFPVRAGQKCWIVASEDFTSWKQIYFIEAPKTGEIEYRRPVTASDREFYRVISSGTP